MDLIPINIVIFSAAQNGDFVVANINKMAQNTQNVLKEDVIGKKFTEVFRDVKDAGLFEVFERVYKSGISEVYELNYYEDSRRCGWRKNTVIKLKNTTIMTMYEDLSAQKKLEDELVNHKLLEEKILQTNRDLEEKVQQRTEEQNILLSLFDKGSSVLFKWNNDVNWSVAHVSQSVERLLGYSKSDFIENKIVYADCVYKKDLPRVIREVNQAIEEQKDYFEHEPYRVYTRSGTIKWVFDGTVIVRNNENKVINFVGHIIDITLIKEKDKQLLQHYKLAQMGEMISMIAHQWRQPLGAISVTAANLKMSMMLKKYDFSLAKDVDECVRYFDKNLSNIEDFTQTLSQTIDDFRYFYKSNKKSVLLTIDKPVVKALNIIEASLKNNGIALTKDFKSKQELNLFDSEMMQVILNILKNSQDNFLERRTKNPKLKIVSYDTNESVVLEICDNGGGIPEDIINNICEPYFSTKDEKNGTGLGLYMSKIIIEEHHKGSLKIKNVNGSVCFCMELYYDKLKAASGSIC
ncbi:PAS domain-containing protein [bacterium]|nr:PAS domain-containing protein [bacterium]